MDMQSQVQKKYDVIDRLVRAMNALPCDTRRSLRNFSFAWQFGDLCALFKVEGGRIGAPQFQPGITASWDFSVSAPDEVWAEYLCPVPKPPYHHLFAMWARVPAFRLDGNREVMARHAAWLNEMFTLARQAWNATSTDAPPATAAPAEPAAGKESIEAGFWRIPVQGEMQRIYVEQAGSGPDLLLLHTAGSDSRQYYRLLNDNRLTSQWRLTAFDLPGHGKSLPPASWAGKQYRLEEDAYVAQILAVCDALGLKRPVVLGCSMAGAVCLRLAQRHATRFGGVIACEAAQRIPSRLNHWLLHPAVDSAEFAPQWIDGLMAPTTDPLLRQEILWCYSQAAAGVFHGDVAYYSGSFEFTEQDMRETDTSVCPVYMLTGAYDYSCTPEMSAATAEKIHGAHFKAMNELGHFPVAENTEGFMRYLLPILGELAQGTPRPQA